MATANQWGRGDGGRSGGSGGRAQGFVAVLIAFALGVAGGYGVLRIFGPGNGSAIEAAQKTAEAFGSENSRLKDQLAAIRSELADAKAAAGAGQGADEAGLLDRIAQQAGELDALTEKLATISREKEEATATAVEQGVEILRLKNQLAGAKDDVSAELARLKDEVLPKLTVERDRLARQAEELNGQLAAATKELADMKAQATAGAALQDEPAEPDAVAAPQDGNAAGGSSLTPREPGAVEEAMRNAKVLDALSEPDRRKLKDALVAGECVTTALEAVYEHVPIVALRDLILGLNSRC